MERETKIITTPIDGVKIVLKSWINGLEKRELQSVFMKDASLNSEIPITVSGQKLSEYQDKTIENVVVSVRDKDDNILKDVLELKVKDFEFVIAEVSKVINGEEIDEKK